MTIKDLLNALMKGELRDLQIFVEIIMDVSEPISMSGNSKLVNVGEDCIATEDVEHCRWCDDNMKNCDQEDATYLILPRKIL